MRRRTKSFGRVHILGEPKNNLIVKNIITPTQGFALLNRFQQLGDRLCEVVRDKSGMISEDFPSWLSEIIQKIAEHTSDLPEKIEFLTIGKSSPDVTLSCKMIVTIGSRTNLKLKNKNEIYKFDVECQSLVIFPPSYKIVVPKDKDRTFTLYCLIFS